MSEMTNGRPHTSFLSPVLPFKWDTWLTPTSTWRLSIDSTVDWLKQQHSASDDTSAQTKKMGGILTMDYHHIASMSVKSVFKTGCIPMKIFPTAKLLILYRVNLSRVRLPTQEVRVITAGDRAAEYKSGCRHNI